jgi:hypothetical protein
MRAGQALDPRLYSGAAWKTGAEIMTFFWGFLTGFAAAFAAWFVLVRFAIWLFGWLKR